MEKASLEKILQKLNHEEQALIAELLRQDPLNPVYGPATAGYVLVLSIVLLWSFDFSAADTDVLLLLDFPFGIWSFKPGFLRDIISNIVFFIPYAFFLSGFLRQHMKQTGREWLLITGSGFLLSMGIEILQYWLPARHSSAMDVATNVTGTMMGVIVHRGYDFLLDRRYG